MSVSAISQSGRSIWLDKAAVYRLSICLGRHTDCNLYLKLDNWRDTGVSKSVVEGDPSLRESHTGGFSVTRCPVSIRSFLSK